MIKGYNPHNYTERALELLEKDICYLSRTNWGYGMSPEDVQQELRIHLYNKLDKYDYRKNIELRTWAQRVMRMKLIDLYRGWEYGRNSGIPRNLLDHQSRQFYEDIGDKELSEGWVYEEFFMVTVVD